MSEATPLPPTDFFLFASYFKSKVGRPVICYHCGGTETTQSIQRHYPICASCQESGKMPVKSSTGRGPGRAKKSKIAVSDCSSEKD